MRVMLATQGSGGDLFPFLAIAHGLQARGHTVVVVAPATLAVVSRAAGVPAAPFGSRPVRPDGLDDLLVTDRDDGWASWHASLERFYAPTLADDTDDVRAFIRRFAPEVAIAHSLCFAAVGACRAEGVAALHVHLYPQFVERSAYAWSSVDGVARRPPPDGFAAGLAEALRVEAERLGLPATGDPVFDWGRSDHGGVVPHAPALAPSTRWLDGRAAPVGYPSFDAVEPPGQPPEDPAAWLGGDGVRVLVAAGSFIGALSGDDWEALEQSAWDDDWRVAILGATRDWRERLARHPRVRAFGFVPLSRVVAHADLAVHHGGLGTAYRCLAAALPAVVVPRAFDQLDNARWLAGRGTAVVHDRDGSEAVADVLRRVADDPSLRRRGVEAASVLRPTDEVVATITRRLGELVGA